MTKIAVPVLLAAAILAALIPIVGAPRPELYLATGGGHSNPSHDVRLAGSPARQIVLSLLTYWVYASSTGGPDPDDFRCGLIKAAGKVVRVVVFMATGPQAGVLAFYNPGSREWGGAYIKGGTTPESFSRGPSTETMAKKGWDSWESGPDSCRSLPPGGLPPLQPAGP